MSERQSLLAAVAESPHDDAVRLVFADWLEEHDEPKRAEAIRLGVRRRALDDLDPEAWVLDARLYRLGDRSDSPWRDELPKHREIVWFAPRGGFCEGAAVDSARWLGEHEEIAFSAAPLTFLRVNVEKDSREPNYESAKELVKCQRLRQVRRLQLAGMVHGDRLGLDRLSSGEVLSDLRELVLSESAHEDDLIRALARCRAWPSLDRLDLHRGLFTDLRPLARSQLFESLRSLNLSRCEANRAGLGELAREGRFANFRDLSLSENGIGDETVRVLAECCERLERLDLSCNDFWVGGVAALAGSARMASLRSLDLGINSDLGDAAAAELAKSPHLGALVELDLASWSLKPKGVRALVAAPWMRNIRRLRLAWFSAGKRGIEALASADLPSLRWLDLYGSTLKDADLKPLLGAKWLSQLISLDLHDNALTAKTARALAESPALEGLESLTINKNQIDDSAKERLRQRFGERVKLTSPWD